MSGVRAVRDKVTVSTERSCSLTEPVALRSQSAAVASLTENLPLVLIAESAVEPLITNPWSGNVITLQQKIKSHCNCNMWNWIPTTLEARFMPFMAASNFLFCGEDCLATAGAEVGALGSLDHHPGAEAARGSWP